jgi:hypothetical protein
MFKSTAKPTKIYRNGFVCGLADMVSVRGRARKGPFPGTGMTAMEAFTGDWIKLGADMQKAVEKVVAVRGQG